MLSRVYRLLTRLWHLVVLLACVAGIPLLFKLSRASWQLAEAGIRHDAVTGEAVTGEAVLWWSAFALCLGGMAFLSWEAIRRYLCLRQGREAPPADTPSDQV